MAILRRPAEADSRVTDGPRRGRASRTSASAAWESVISSRRRGRARAAGREGPPPDAAGRRARHLSRRTTSDRVDRESGEDRDQKGNIAHRGMAMAVLRGMMRSTLHTLRPATPSKSSSPGPFAPHPRLALDRVVSFRNRRHEGTLHERTTHVRDRQLMTARTSTDQHLDSLGNRKVPLCEIRRAICLDLAMLRNFEYKTLDSSL